MKKVFIDCGYFRGRSTDLFKETKEYDPDFVLYAFEPTLKKDYKFDGIVFSEQVVWIYDGEIEYHTSGRRVGQANSVFCNPRAKGETVLTLPCLDFSKWIKETFDKDDYIVLKMDIEGAEQEVLEKMVEDGSIDYLDIAYVEFHSKVKPGYRELKSFLKNLSSLDLRGPIENNHQRYLK